MGDEEDRARLAMMSELEREMELFERGDKRKELIESQAAAKRMQDTQAAQDKVGFSAACSCFIKEIPDIWVWVENVWVMPIPLSLCCMAVINTSHAGVGCIQYLRFSALHSSLNHYHAVIL